MNDSQNLHATFNPSRVDFTSLSLFCAVAQWGSITKGAEVSHLALSAASRRLADFELSTGLQLMERSKKGVTLTPAGHLALQHAMRLFQGFEIFNTELKEYARGMRGHVRLWSNMSALTEFLPEQLKAFLSAHPQIVIDIEEQHSGDIVRALVDGLADIGVFAKGVPTHGLRAYDFKVDELVLLCPKDHPLAKRKAVDFKSCLAYDFVGLNRGSSLLELTARAAQAAGHPMRLRVQVRSFDAMLQMISAGLGIGVVPLAVSRHQVQALNLKTIPLSEAWSKRQLQVAVSGRELSTATQLLLDDLICS